MVIELPPELEHQLQEVAKEHGVPVGDLVRSALETLVATRGVLQAPTPALSPEERAARVDAVVGKYAHLPGSVDEFLRNKHEDNEREEARWERLRQEGKRTP